MDINLVDQILALQESKLPADPSKVIKPAEEVQKLAEADIFTPVPEEDVPARKAAYDASPEGQAAQAEYRQFELQEELASAIFDTLEANAELVKTFSYPALSNVIAMAGEFAINNLTDVADIHLTESLDEGVFDGFNFKRALSILMGKAWFDKGLGREEIKKVLSDALAKLENQPAAAELAVSTGLKESHTYFVSWKTPEGKSESKNVITYPEVSELKQELLQAKATDVEIEVLHMGEDR